jgi:hypothetical protein
MIKIGFEPGTHLGRCTPELQFIANELEVNA